MTFRDIALRESDLEYYEYTKAVYIIENSLYINEGFFDSLASGIKDKIDFIKKIAEVLGKNVTDIIELFKDKKVFKIFTIIGFSINKIVDLYKSGVKTYNNIQNILAAKIASLGGVKYIKKNLHVLDDFFNEHPILKKLGGVAVAGLLFYIWCNMAYSVDIQYSLDFTDILQALAGKFSLGDLFASESGVSMLIYLASGALLGLSFPIPGAQAYHIVTGLIWSAYRIVKKDGGAKEVVLRKPKI